MKTTFRHLLLGLLAAAPAIATAQDGLRPTQDDAIHQQRIDQRNARIAERTEAMAAKLGLSEEQTASFKQAEAEMMSALDALRASSADRATKQAKAEEIKAKRDERLKELMTPEQYTEYQRLRDEERMRMSGVMQNAKGTPANE